FAAPGRRRGACETGSKTGGIPGRRRGCRRLHTAARGRREGRRWLGEDAAVAGRRRRPPPHFTTPDPREEETGPARRQGPFGPIWRGSTREEGAAADFRGPREGGTREANSSGAVGGALGDRRDLRPVDAEVGPVAGCRRVELAHRFAVDTGAPAQRALLARHTADAIRKTGMPAAHTTHVRHCRPLRLISGPTARRRWEDDALSAAAAQCPRGTVLPCS